jgi:hypothetical protein
VDLETGALRGPHRPHGVMVALVVGALWGMAGYLLLWGHTPVVVYRDFVVSPGGTLLLLPVRLVLATIRFVEEQVVEHPFEFAANNGWIGVAAATVGAALAVVAFVLVRAVFRRVRQPAGS